MPAGLQVGQGGSGSVAINAVGMARVANNRAAASHFRFFFTVKFLSKVNYTVIMCCPGHARTRHASNFCVPKV